MICQLVFNKSKTASATRRAGNAYPSGAPEFTPVFSGVHVTQFFVLCVMFCRSLFIVLSFFFWLLCCLSFFGLQILITSLWYIFKLF